MKTHLIWFLISLGALMAGFGLARRPVRVVEQPVPVVKEVFVDRPVVVRKDPPPGGSAGSSGLPFTPALVPTKRTPEERAKLHRRYGPLLMKLSLSDAQRERFVELKLAIYDAQDDLQAAVRQNGVPGGAAGVAALRSRLVKPMWDEIRQILGEEGYQAYGDYEQMSAIRPIAAGVFEAARAAVADEQVEQLARLLLAHQEIYRAEPTDISSRVRFDWAAIAREAEKFLTPQQLAAVRLKAEREAKQ